MLATCYILNRIPSKKNQTSPYEIWKRRKPNIGYLKVYECLAYYKNLDPKRTKLDPRGIKSAFVGYASNSKAFKLLDLEFNVILESRDVEFFENLTTKGKSSQAPTHEDSRDESFSRVVEKQLDFEKSKRVRKIKDLGPDEIDSQFISFYLVEGSRQYFIRKVPITLLVEDDPKTFKEAMALRDSAF